MIDALRRILYHCFVTTVIATVWTMGWARAATERAARGYLPPENPALFEFDDVTDHDTAAIDGR